MIQRVQTIFLLLAFILQVIMFILPVSEFTVKGNNNLIMYATGFVSEGFIIDKMYNTSVVLIFLSFTSLLTLATIFLYKRRPLQMRICIYNVILTIGFQVVLIWFVHQIGTLINAAVTYKYPFIFPLVSAILLILAFRYIRKDEKLIRSLDRIR